MSDVEITAVREAHKFDETSLNSYLEQEIPSYKGPLTVKQFEGGQSNPTFQLITPKKTYVLRKQPPGDLLPSAHQVDREFKVMHALWDTPVPVPEMFLLCEDIEVIGTKFYVMEMVEGRLFTETRLPQLPKKERKSLYEDLARVLAELHKVDPAQVGLSEFGRSGNYYERQISRWSKQYISSQTEQIDAMDNLMKWLPENIPQASSSTIVHGDFRLGNVLVHPEEPKVAAVLDWELSTLGDGLADLGYMCQEYHGDSESPDGLAGADLELLGIMTESDMVNTYCSHLGLDGIDNWEFYLIYNMFRSAGIIQGVYKRGLDGNASSDKALEYKESARLRSEQAWSLVRETQRS
jgi:aminoglycoside phosphotransferase (APT) family kinase protein